MKYVLTFFLLLTAFAHTTNAHQVNSSLSSFTIDDNSMAEFLKSIIKKEGIKSYKVTYTDYEKDQSRTYFNCTFPGYNLISFGESGNLKDVDFNLNQLVRYSVFKKNFKREESISRLELIF